MDLQTNIVFTILQFVYGAALGSFYITTAERVLLFFYGKERKQGTKLERLKKLFTIPSHCPHCKTPVSPLHLIPVLGFFLTKGKCKSCHSKLSWTYPVSELFFGIVVVTFFQMTGSLGFAVFFPFLLGHLMISLYTDANYFSLDYENLVFILAFGLVCNYFLLEEWPALTDLYVFLGFAGFYLALYLVYRKGIGFGDVLFAPVFAFLSGHPWWMMFLNSSYLIATIVTLLSRKKGESLRGKAIPMGVYFSIGLFFTYLSKILFIHLGIEGITIDETE
ncbi:peptidase [Leptospira kobayashii]|uniref:Peptidase n=1 Tax=Leptospira kobayashii TaxID=1917830 RepID=A0ABM7UI81_9LEPT|nr:A24 family peptidase [Leptospira kobayashii]BDA78426.1 peptidase [Leptospira kobayashii]